MNAFDLTTFFFSKAKVFFQQLWLQSAWFRNARQVLLSSSLTNWLLPTHSKLLFVRNLSNDLFFEVKNFQPFIYILYVYCLEDLPFFHQTKKQIQSRNPYILFKVGRPFPKCCPPALPGAGSIDHKRLTNEIDKKMGMECLMSSIIFIKETKR